MVLHCVGAKLSSVVCVERDCTAVCLFLRTRVVGTEAAPAPKAAGLKQSAVCMSVGSAEEGNGKGDGRLLQQLVKSLGVVCRFNRAGG